MKRFFPLVFLCCYGACAQTKEDFKKEMLELLRPLVIEQAEQSLKERPITITATQCERSAGSKHDFYSEGDYWWPDPTNPNGPYIQRDGETNPNNFVSHRQAMIRFSKIVGALTSGYVLTRENRYASHALNHLRAWFVDATTMMNPSLLYAQAIKGRATGRGIGIIDTIHLMEVAQSAYILQSIPGTDRALINGIKQWFEKYLEWLTTHSYGKDEMNAENNHGTCWTMQVGAFARLTNNTALLDLCRDRFKNIHVPNQMDVDGSFPRELRRTKPYGYSLFNLDAMAMICQILSDDKINLWNFRLPDGRSVKKGIEFMFPYVKDKNKWELRKDVMYWDQWPVAQPFLVFGAMEFNNRDWFVLWKSLDHDPQIDEVIRNLPIRNPIIWMY